MVWNQLSKQIDRNAGRVAVAALLAFCLPVVAIGETVPQVTVCLVTPESVSSNSTVDTYDCERGAYSISNVGLYPNFVPNSTISPLSLPLGLPSLESEVAFEGNGTTEMINDDIIHANKLLIKGNHRVVINGKVIWVVRDTLTVENYSSIQLMEGATLCIYILNVSKFQDHVAVNYFDDNDPNGVDTANPGKVKIYNLGTKAIFIQNNTSVCASIITPDARLEISDGSNYYGYFKGKTVKVVDWGGAHFCDIVPDLSGLSCD